MGFEHDKVLSEVRDYLIMTGGRAWRTHQGGKKRGDAGMFDMYCVAKVRRGRQSRSIAFWFDAKVGKDRVSADQAAFREVCRQAGVPCVHGRQCDVIDFLERLSDPGFKDPEEETDGKPDDENRA